MLAFAIVNLREDEGTENEAEDSDDENVVEGQDSDADEGGQVGDTLPETESEKPLEIPGDLVELLQNVCLNEKLES